MGRCLLSQLLFTPGEVRPPDFCSVVQRKIPQNPRVKPSTFRVGPVAGAKRQKPGTKLFKIHNHPGILHKGEKPQFALPSSIQTFTWNNTFVKSTTTRETNPKVNKIKLGLCSIIQTFAFDLQALLICTQLFTTTSTKYPCST